MVEILIQNIHSLRTQNWEAFKESLRMMLLGFVSMTMINMADSKLNSGWKSALQWKRSST